MPYSQPDPFGDRAAYEAHLHNWHKAARVAQACAVVLNRWLPVEDKAWPLAGDRSDGWSILAGMLGRFIHLESLVNPHQLPFEDARRCAPFREPPGEGRYGAIAGRYCELHASAHGLVLQFDAIVRHYGWQHVVRPATRQAETWRAAYQEARAWNVREDCLLEAILPVGGGTFVVEKWLYRAETWGWAWPNPPPIAAETLRLLCRCAARLGRETADHLDRRREGALVSPPAEAPTQPAASAETPAELTFRLGGFCYRTASVDLKGKPLAILRELAGARDRTRSADDLLKAVCKDYVVQESTLRTHVHKARQALWQAITKAGVEFQGDPILCIDRGPGALAWRLAELP